MTKRHPLSCLDGFWNRCISRKKFLKMVLTASLSLAGLPAGMAQGRKSEPGVYDAVIVGGGISGLAAAYLVEDDNILVLEKDNVPGGRIITGKYGDLYYPKGMEYIGNPEDDIKEFLDELHLKPEPILPPTSAVLFQGRIFSGKSLFNFLDTEKSSDDYERLLEMLYDFHRAGINEEALFEKPEILRKHIELDGVSVESWLEAKQIDKLVQKLVDVENRGLFGSANRDLSMLFNIPEMGFNLPESVSDADAGLYTFPKGMIEVVWALEKRLGDRIKKNARVMRVKVNADKTVSITYKQGRRTEEIKTYAAVLTCPAPITASIVDNGFSDRVFKALDRIAYSVYVTLNLFTRGRPWHEAWSGACLDDFFVTIYDGIHGQVPPDYDEQGVLGVYIAPETASDQSLFKLPNTEIVKRCLRDLEKYKPDISKKVKGYDIHRFKYAFPVFRPGYHAILDTLYSDPTTNGPLFLAGDYMAYPTFDGAVVSALRAYEKMNEYFKE